MRICWELTEQFESSLGRLHQTVIVIQISVGSIVFHALCIHIVGDLGELGDVFVAEVVIVGIFFFLLVAGWKEIRLSVTPSMDLDRDIVVDDEWLLTYFGGGSCQSTLTFLMVCHVAFRGLCSKLSVRESTGMHLTGSFVTGHFDATLLGRALFTVLWEGTVGRLHFCHLIFLTLVWNY